MSVSIIVARAKDSAIGRKNGLPWNLPNDLKRFSQLTRDHTVVMGQTTFESIKGMIGSPLPGRHNVIATRDPGFSAEGCDITLSLEDFLTDAQKKSEEIFVIGGASIYKQALVYANKLYITEIETTVPDADAFFPEVSETEWEVVSEDKHPADDKHAFIYNFVIYERK
jgi:dihydrofolate reductase